MRKFALLAAATMLLVLAACGDGTAATSRTTSSAPSVTESASAAPTSSRSATSVPAATPPPTATPTPPPASAPPVPLHAVGTRTGVWAVDAVVGALERSDARGLVALVEYSLVPCKPNSAVGGSTADDAFFPECAADVAPGTPVEAILTARCDSGWVPRGADYFLPALERFASAEFALFALSRLPGPAARSIEQGGEPGGDYFVVMDDPRQPSGEPRGAIVSAGGVVGLFTGCFFAAPGDFLTSHYYTYTAGDQFPKYLLPPLP